jgi:hypothetical protein
MLQESGLLVSSSRPAVKEIGHSFAQPLFWFRSVLVSLAIGFEMKVSGIPLAIVSGAYLALPSSDWRLMRRQIPSERLQVISRIAAMTF